ncbi:MAG TPA: alpha/beta hydrolase [Pseudomonadales bacterium]|nr:alpha/beta hydrolase [Pseudomonadales bacterium]
MPRAIVHGVPETSAIWQSLAAALAARGEEDLVLLSPPGFGAPLPTGFEPGREAYAHWLVAQLEALGGDVDLVGHDWGAGHVFGALDLRPDLIRSWATDCAGLLHPAYVWHEMAQVWQTPEAGEQAIAEMLAVDPATRAAGFAELGMPAATATDLATAQDADMGRAILGLYRSAAQPAMRELGARLQSQALPPGLILLPTEDPYVGPLANTVEVAERLATPVCRIEDLGHWWMFAAADAVAAALIAHWARA